MIKSFADRHTRLIFLRQPSRRVRSDLPRVALRKLVQVNAAASLEFLRVPPGNRLERLAGERAGQYSIRINDQWRICFRWNDGDAYEVEIVDYH